jgi:hypothetical protein
MRERTANSGKPIRCEDAGERRGGKWSWIQDGVDVDVEES